MKETGGAAYPTIYTDSEGNVVNSTSGMTLRDYFAGQALVGILSGEYREAINIQDPISESYIIADTMLKKRNKE